MMEEGAAAYFIGGTPSIVSWAEAKVKGFWLKRIHGQAFAATRVSWTVVGRVVPCWFLASLF